MNELAAYLAGIIDGEGTITIQKRRAGRPGCIPHVSIANTCHPLLVKCMEIGGVVGHICRKKRSKPQHKESYVLHWRCNAALAIVSMVIPYLLVKKPQADLLLTWKQVVIPNGKYTPKQLSRRDALVAAIHRLNQRGSGAVGIETESRSLSLGYPGTLAVGLIPCTTQGR